MKKRLAMLISGGGSTMEYVAKACLSGEVDLDVVVVIASNEKAGGLEKAKQLSIPTAVVSPNDFKKDGGEVDREAFDNALLAELKKHQVDIVTQNGWLPLTPENVIAAFEGRIFNQHPGPLPETTGLYGRQPHAAMLYLAKNLGNRGTEVVVQRVDKVFDKGAIVGRAKVEILSGDTVETLQGRCLPLEHRLQVEFLKKFVAGELRDEEQEYRYIKPGEEGALRKAREFARKEYPKG